MENYLLSLAKFNDLDEIGSALQLQTTVAKLDEAIKKLPDGVDKLTTMKDVLKKSF